MPSALVALAAADRAAVLSMERPPVNAMNRALMSELEANLNHAATDPAVRVIVVTSAIPGMFSGGADIRELEGLDAAGCAAFIALGQGLFSRMGEIPKPIIAAVNGTCLGGGMELSMACDLRIAARSARFGHPEVNLGVVSGWGGTQRLPRLVGKTRGLEMLMLGEQITADEEQAVGRGRPLPLVEGLREEARCYADAYVSEDAREGIRAFLEKRPARFPGR